MESIQRKASIKSMLVAYEIQWPKIVHSCGYYCIKNFVNQGNHMIVCGTAAIFSAITMSSFIVLVLTRWMCLDEWLGII